MTVQNLADRHEKLGAAWLANQADTDTEHVVVVLPSHSVAGSLLSHDAQRIPALEHRYLVAYLLLHRFQHCEIVYVCSQAPEPDVLDYYAALVPDSCAEGVWSRFHCIVVGDHTVRSTSAKLLDRPDLLRRMRASFRGRPVLIQPWNVTDLEVEVARRLHAPLLGTPPELSPLGYKSAGRRIIAATGVSVPFGREDVRSVDEIVEAMPKSLRRAPRQPVSSSNTTTAAPVTATP
jgi:hypothetical protein